VAIEKIDGTVVKERLHSSEHAEGQSVDAPWDAGFTEWDTGDLVGDGPDSTAALPRKKVLPDKRGSALRSLDKARLPYRPCGLINASTA
jgi:hypothetical protein